MRIKSLLFPVHLVCSGLQQSMEIATSLAGKLGLQQKISGIVYGIFGKANSQLQELHTESLSEHVERKIKESITQLRGSEVQELKNLEQLRLALTPESENYTLQTAIRKVRALRDDTTTEVELSEDVAFGGVYRKRAPACAIIQEMTVEERCIAEFCHIGECPYEALRKEVLAAGGELVAHGVSDQKQGITSLLNIMLVGFIRSPWYGALKDGRFEWTAGPHGPFYIILDEEEDVSPRALQKLTVEIHHLAYLIPDESHRCFLTTALEKAVAVGMLREDEKTALCSKLMTYAEFLALRPDDRKDASSFGHAMIVRKQDAKIPVSAEKAL